MLSHKVNDETSLCLSMASFAEELFALTDKNRTFLRQWLPWLDSVQTPSDSQQFILNQLKLLSEGKALHLCIFHQGRLAGCLAFNQIDNINGIGKIGYWLGQEFNGQGIMTTSVRQLIQLGQQYYSLQKIEIRCATGNHRSMAIPQRLGFTQEGTLHRAEKVNDQYYDHHIYSLLLD